MPSSSAICLAVHLNRLYHNTEEELRLFYYNKGVEVDFCVPEENLAVQVSYNIDDAETYEREVGGLVKFLKAFKSYHGTIVTLQIGSQALTLQMPDCLNNYY